MSERIKAYWKQSFVVIALLGVTLLIVLLIDLWTRSVTTSERNEVMRTVLTAVGATALLLQLRYTHQTTRTAIRTQEVTERGNEHDLFFRATEQLGSTSEEARLGALYSLESLARDSDRYYDQVI